MGLYNKLINLSLHEHKDLPTHIKYSEYKILICIKSFFKSTTWHTAKTKAIPAFYKE